VIILLAELSDLELSSHAKEVFSQLEQDNDFNMVVDYTVYKMNYEEIGREYGICGSTVKHRIFKKINR
jgi:hypothetical protein